jgi:DDE superfamily endonuclease
MLVLDGYKSHVNVEFNKYYKENNIIPLYLPAHSSHLTQPLNISVFSLLKKAYSNKILFLARANVTYITKDDFFPTFQTAFKKTFTTKNVRGGFKGARLVPLDLEAVLSKLNVRLRTPSPPKIDLGPPQPWVSKTPETTAEALS